MTLWGAWLPQAARVVVASVYVARLGLWIRCSSPCILVWSDLPCLGGRGALWILFVLSVSYVLQHCSVNVVFTYVGCMLLFADSLSLEEQISMVPGALLLACLIFLFYNAESRVFSQ
jgi:hypothetical protein